MSSVQTSHQPKVLQEFEEHQARLDSQASNKSPVYSSPVDEEQQSFEKLQDESKSVSAPEQFKYTRNLLKEGLPPRTDSEMEVNTEEEQNWDGKELLFSFCFKVIILLWPLMISEITSYRYLCSKYP